MDYEDPRKREDVGGGQRGRKAKALSWKFEACSDELRQAIVYQAIRSP